MTEAEWTQQPISACSAISEPAGWRTDVVPPSNSNMQAETEVPPDCPMDALPDELLLAILSLLPVDTLCDASWVCRRWRAVAGCAELWRGQDAVYELSSCPDSTFCRTLALAPQLRSVTFKIGFMPEEVVNCILKGCENVKRLAFNVQLRVRPSSLAAILRHFSEHLQEVDLFVETPEILPVIRSLRALRTLRLRGWIPGPGWRAVAVDLSQAVQGCPELQHLDLEGLDGPCIPQLILVLTAAKAVGHRLKQLTLPSRQVVMSDQILTEVLSACPGLVSLGAEWGAVLGLGTLPALTSLRLWYSYQDPGPSLFNALLRADVRAVLSRLGHLDLVLGASTEFAGALLSMCSSLKSLSVTTDRPAVQLPQLRPPRCLSHLQLRCSPRRAGMDLLEDPHLATGLSELGARLPHLAVVEVNGHTLNDSQLCRLLLRNNNGDFSRIS